MSGLATIRWGDSFNFDLKVVAGARSLKSSQLVMATWRNPASWNVILIGQPVFDPSETATWTLSWQFVVGCGQGTLSGPLFTMSFAAGGGYALQQTQQLIPASDLRISAFLTCPNSTATREQSFGVGAFVAINNAEPFDREPYFEAEGERRFMGPDFDDGGMSYPRLRR